MTQRRTYWHLEALGRRPSDYEVVSYRLTYAPAPGTSVRTPWASFHAAHAPDQRLTTAAWERFADPLATTYASYVARQRDRELVVETLLDGIDGSGYDRELDPAWRTHLGVTLSVLRFPGHALQMTAAYLGRLAPASPVIIAFAFTAADELRRVQRFAYRLRQLADLDAGLPEAGRQNWQSAAEWQPLRRLCERMLATLDWVECFAVTSLLMKPVFDALVLHEWPRAAARHDAMLTPICASLWEDARWHSDLAFALAELITRAGAADVAELARALATWRDTVDAALSGLGDTFGVAAHGALAARDRRLASIGLAGGAT